MNDFDKTNQAKIEAAVDNVKKYYGGLLSRWDDPNYNREEHRRMMDGMHTLIDAWNWLHAHYHHFQKYHAAEGDAWERGDFYLGTECKECEFSRSQQRAIDDNAKLTR